MKPRDFASEILGRPIIKFGGSALALVGLFGTLREVFLPPDVQARLNLYAAWRFSLGLPWYCYWLALLLLLLMASVRGAFVAVEARDQRIEELERMRDARPWVVAEYSNYWVDDDPDAPEPYLCETLQFRNLGKEPALNVSILPIEICGLKVDINEPIRSLTPTDPAVQRSISFESRFKRAVKKLGLDSKQPIQVPLVVEYHDRNHNRLDTKHVLIYRQYRKISLAVADPNAKYEWTNLSL